jgi:anti-sigma-K factor RskA
MSFSYGQQRQLRLIGASLRRSDPHMGAMFGIFGRLYPDQDMPHWEQVAQSRLRRAAAWIVAAFAAMAVAITVLIGKAVTMAAPRRRAPAQASSAQRERTRPRPDGSA